MSRGIDLQRREQRDREERDAPPHDRDNRPTQGALRVGEDILGRRHEPKAEEPMREGPDHGVQKPGPVETGEKGWDGPRQEDERLHQAATRKGRVPEKREDQPKDELQQHRDGRPHHCVAQCVPEIGVIPGGAEMLEPDEAAAERVLELDVAERIGDAERERHEHDRGEQHDRRRRIEIGSTAMRSRRLVAIRRAGSTITVMSKPSYGCPYVVIQGHDARIPVGVTPGPNLCSRTGPGTHEAPKSWMAGPSPAMTYRVARNCHFFARYFCCALVKYFAQSCAIF